MINTIQWQKERDERTTKLTHCMYDGSKKVAIVKSVKHPYGRFEVKIKDAVAWHRRTLDIAKRDCEYVYLNTKR